MSWPQAAGAGRRRGGWRRRSGSGGRGRPPAHSRSGGPPARSAARGRCLTPRRRSPRPPGPQRPAHDRPWPLASSGWSQTPPGRGRRAARKRSGSSIQARGRYSSRSTTACPARLAYTRQTATWAFSTRPAVPVYWRCTPTVAIPFLRSPVSSTNKTASGSPTCSTSKVRTSSRTASWSHTARASRCCIPSGLASPACSAIVQRFLRGRSESSPLTNALARRRSSTRANRPATRPITSSNSSCHRAGSTATLWPAATV
jgi:hypothetical protein